MTMDLDCLRRQLDELGSRADDGLIPYERWRAPVPPGLYWRLRWFAGRVLRGLKVMLGRHPDHWPVGLKQVARSERAKPLLIWAVGVERDTLRTACDGIARMQRDLPGFAPVLITDVADFAFFARLGWLVEYVPAITGEGTEYKERKTRFLARLYRGAPALPIGVGLDSESRMAEICESLLRGITLPRS